MMKFGTSLFAVLTFCAPFALALYAEGGAVVALTKDNFAQYVMSNDNVVVVEFYAPWCGHCKHFAPEYTKAAESQRGIVRFGAVDCDSQKELCGAFGIQGFPTVKIFPSELTKTDKGFTKMPKDYTGPRTAAAVANEAVSMLPDFSAPIFASNEDKFFKASGIAKTVLFTDKDKTPTLYKALAIDFHRGMGFGVIKKDQIALVNKYKVTKFPTIIVVPADGGEPVTYQGPIQVEPLKKFLFPYFKTPEVHGPEGGKQAQPEQEAAWELERIVSSDQFKEKCLGSKVICALAFLDPYNFPYEQDDHESTLLQLTEKFKKRVQFVWVGQVEQPDLVKAFDLRSGFPAMVAINPRLVDGKLRYSRFTGSFDMDSMTNFFDAVLKGLKGYQETTVPRVADIDPEDFKAPPPIEDEEDYVEVQKEL